MDKKRDNLSRQLLRYLEKNPEAGDTLEGIAGWWLEQERIDHVVEEVAAALEHLAIKGQIRIVKTTPGSTVYKIEKK